MTNYAKTPVTPKACPKTSGQVQFRAHARAAFAALRLCLLNHSDRIHKLSICNAEPYRACVSDQEYLPDRRYVTHRKPSGCASAEGRSWRSPSPSPVPVIKQVYASDRPWNLGIDPSENGQLGWPGASGSGLCSDRNQELGSGWPET